MKFLFGLIVGVGIAMVLAPARGEETRRVLADRVRRLPELSREKAENVAEEAKEKVGEFGARIGRKAAESAVETIKENVLRKKKRS